MKKITLILCLLYTCNLSAQQDSLKLRLDFAKMYFEVGGTFLPSFEGKFLQNNEVQTFDNSTSVISYLNWGGFHFWGHGEFYVSIPIDYQVFKTNKATSSELYHSVVTGFRAYPWVIRQKKITPFVGINWSALDFQQIISPENEQTVLSKNFALTFDAGLLYAYNNFALRVGLHYTPNTKWNYPISKTQKATINTPNLGLQIGLLYAFDSTRDTDQENIDKWNAYPTVSKQSLGSKSFGNFFVGAGPSISFSLKNSAYNQSIFPYLSEKLSSTNYFDFVLGYNFNKAGLFTALSFRNPTFETEGFGTKQSIKKTSFAIELNKFLIDYSGFTPYIGLSLAYDKINYSEEVDEVNRTLVFDKKFTPGIIVGWDIQPGKNQEALILRTNLKWYPSSFDIDGKAFNFSQLEYNLIQVLFYPERLKKRKK